MLILQESPPTFKSSKTGCIGKESPPILQTNRSLSHKCQPDQPEYRLHVSHSDNPGVTKSTKCYSQSDSSEVYQNVLGVRKAESPRVLHAVGDSVLAKEEPGVLVLHKPRAVCHKDGGTLHRCQNSMSKAEKSQIFQTTKAMYNKETPGVMKTNRNLNAGDTLGPFNATPMHVSESPDVFKSTKCLKDVQNPGMFRSPNTMSVMEASRTLRTSRSMSVSETGSHSFSPRTFAEVEKVKSLGRLNTVYENDRTEVKSVSTAYTFKEDITVTSNPRTFTLKEEQKYLGVPVTFAMKDKPADLGDLKTLKHQEETKRNVPLKTSINRKERSEIFFASNTTFSRVGVTNDTILRRLENISDEQSRRLKSMLDDQSRRVKNISDGQSHSNDQARSSKGISGDHSHRMKNLSDDQSRTLESISDDKARSSKGISDDQSRRMKNTSDDHSRRFEIPLSDQFHTLESNSGEHSRRLESPSGDQPFRLEMRRLESVPGDHSCKLRNIMDGQVSEL